MMKYLIYLIAICIVLTNTGCQFKHEIDRDNHISAFFLEAKGTCDELKDPNLYSYCFAFVNTRSKLYYSLLPENFEECALGCQVRYQPDQYRLISKHSKHSTSNTKVLMPAGNSGCMDFCMNNERILAKWKSLNTKLSKQAVQNKIALYEQSRSVIQAITEIANEKERE